MRMYVYYIMYVCMYVPIMYVPNMYNNYDLIINDIGPVTGRGNAYF